MNQTLLDIIKPARQIALSHNPAQQFAYPHPIGPLHIEDTTSPATAAKLAELVAHYAKPSKRTYYLGRCGRVSQRRHLVGEVIATVRACNTDQARYLFSNYETMRTYPARVPKPFIGEPVLCKCGWHHAKHSECPVCASWKHVGQMILDGTAEA